MLRPLDSATCDACDEPAVTVVAIAGPASGDLLRAVCDVHLGSTLRGATPVSAAAPPNGVER